MNGSASMSKKPLFGSTSLRKASHHKSDFDGPRMAKQLRHSTKLKIGDATDDIHVCIMCLRAIMNNKFGFNMVIGHEQAINCIALSLVSQFFLNDVKTQCFLSHFEIAFDPFRDSCARLRRECA